MAADRDTDDFTHATSARSLRSLAVLALVYGALLAALIWLAAALWIVTLLALFTLPALWDLASGHRAGLTLSRDSLAWFSGNHHDAVPLAQIASVRFDTRLDLSVRVTLILTDGRRIRLPYPCLPPHRAFEAALQAAGVKTERHHFTLLN